MSVLINASTSSGIGLTPDNSGVIQFQSNGANTVQIAANGAILNSSGGSIIAGALIRAPQILTSGTSYTTPANCTAIYVEAVGAGGAGGGSMSIIFQYASGGGGGGYAAKYFSVTANTSYTYAVGGGGAGVSNATGNNGGNTTFTVGGTTITAVGGSGGTRGLADANAVIAGGSGGGATNGDINITGSEGGWIVYGAGTGAWPSTGIPVFQSDPIPNASGSGGTPLGPFTSSGVGRGFKATNANGNAATSFGCGGGGARNTSAAGTGGAGANGVIRIWEYT